MAGMRRWRGWTAWESGDCGGACQEVGVAAYLDALVGPRRAAGKRGHRDGGDDPDAGSALPHPLEVARQAGLLLPARLQNCS